MSEVYSSYQYTGPCSFYATYGKYPAADFTAKASGEELLVLDISKSRVYGYLETSSEEDTLHVSGSPYPRQAYLINPKDPNPFMGCLLYSPFKNLPVDLTQATHLQIKVRAKTSGTLILELYDDDGGDPGIDRNPQNFYLPEKDDDFYKITLKLKPTAAWQTLTIPLKKFVDWNKKQAACKAKVEGVNEDIGNNHLDLKKGEGFLFQVVFVSDTWDQKTQKEISIGKEIKFLKIKGRK